MINPLPIRLLACMLLLSLAVSANPRMNSNSGKTFDELRMLSTFIYASNGYMADGNRVIFDAQYSNNVDMYDAVKMMNPGENFGLLREGFPLIVEARQPIAVADTMHYYMSNLITQVYSLHVEVQYLDNAAAYAELVDRFTNTRTYVSLSTNTVIPFVVNSNPASKAANRFYLVFSSFAAGPLPVKFTGISAAQLSDKTVDVAWTTEEELNVKHYEIERSADGSNFYKLAEVKPASGSGTSKIYHYNDLLTLPGKTFYRIRSVDMDGKYRLSKMAMVQPASSGTGVSIYPNPVTDAWLNIALNNEKQGTFQLSILNNAGQVLYSKTYQTAGSNAIYRLPVAGFNTGHYLLNITSADGKKTTQPVIINH